MTYVESDGALGYPGALSLVAHDKLEVTTSHDLLMREAPIGDALTIELDAADIDGTIVAVRGRDGEVLAPSEMQGGTVEERSADDILGRTGIEGIETES